MQKQAPTLARLLTMVVFSLSCFGLLLFLWLSFGGPIPLKPKGYQFEVAFPEATTLAAEAEVRASGVNIGKVREKVRGTNSTIAILEIDRKYAPIRENAKAQLRSKTLLGETFVELTLGTRDAPTIPEGGRLENRRVSEAVELDEILDALDPYTRQAFRTWQRDLGASVQGRGRDLNDAFGNLPAFVRSGGDLFAELDQEKEALGALVKNTGVVFGALTKREDQLRNLVEAQDDVFTAISNEQEAFAETWRIFPTFLDESKALQARLERFSRKAYPLVRDMQPALRDLAPTLRSLGDLGPDLRRFFVNFDPLIDVSKTSLPATRDVLLGLRPLLVELGPFLQEVNPILEFALGYHVYTLSDMFANLGVSTSARAKNQTGGNSGLGHYLRQFGPQGLETAAIHPNRVSSNRGNAYLNPLGVITSPEAVKYKVLPSFDCRNSGGEREPGGSPATPGCRVQKPFEFKGKLTTRYPRLTASDYGAQGR